jgi:hypothetical protein
MPSRFVDIQGRLTLNKETIVPRFLVLYRGGDAKKLSPKENDVLFKKWNKYMAKLAKSGALQDGGPVQSSAATQLVGNARSIKEKRAGNTVSFVGGYSILEGWNMKAVQNLSKTCPHLTMMDGTIEIVPILAMP